MRRVRNLGICDYIIPIGRKTGQILSLSNYNILLERTWHRGSRDDYSLQVHAKFNASTMNGLQIVCQLFKGKVERSFQAIEFKLYRVAEGSWVETLITTVAPTQDSPVKASAVVTQATLGLNELSGMETYCLEVSALRKRRRFATKVWFNHLGCYDSINQLVRASQVSLVLKMDE